jgi:cation diffusion facilitator family transporter
MFSFTFLNTKKDQNSKVEVYRVTFIGFIVNILLTIFKFLAGFLGKSNAMIADAVHSLSDLISDIIVLIFVKIASKPIDENHRYGHGKFETFSTFVVGMILFVAGLGIIWDSISKIIQNIQGDVPQAPTLLALSAAIVSIVFKELLFWYTFFKSKTLNSQILLANAWHHRSDALSSFATLIGISGAMFLGEQWRILDPIAAALVSFFIFKVSYKIVMPAVKDLLEQSLPKEIRSEIIQIASNVKHVQNPHNLKTRRIGNHYAIEMHIALDKNMTVEESHQITIIIENALKDRFGNETHIGIHVDPA